MKRICQCCGNIGKENEEILRNQIGNWRCKKCIERFKISQTGLRKTYFYNRADYYKHLKEREKDEAKD